MFVIKYAYRGTIVGAHIDAFTRAHAHAISIGRCRCFEQPDVTLFKAERRNPRGAPRAPEGTAKFTEELIATLQPLTEDVGFGSQK